MIHTKRIGRIFSVLVLAIILGAFHWAEEEFTQHITNKLHEFRQRFPAEKAYLHLDKPYYAKGDTLWFKGYLVEGSLHLADSASTLLYVDLVEQRTGRNIALRRVQMDGGLGHGDIVLADSIPGGAYTIRAYTNWMRNFSEDFFFQKNIYVFDQQEAPPAAAAADLDIQFFPEGGMLVGGVITRVAFKAVNGAGLGEDVSGFVLDQNKDTVASFKSQHSGMGRFQFETKQGQAYSAFVKGKDGAPISVKFPQLSDTGYTMIVDNLSNPNKMRIIAYARFPDQKDLPVHVVGHSRGIIAFVAKGKISVKGLMMSIPTAELPDGITHLTLFDEQNKPVSERLVFINHNRNLRVKVNPSKTSYHPREKSEIEITVADTAGNPVQTSLSVAVTDAGQIMQQANDENILSYLLLSSDLKGHIEQPSYYFDPDIPDRKIHLDNLMMTQGWTRFKWDDVMQDSLPGPKRYVEQGITMEGEVKRNNRKPTENIPLSIYLSNDSLNTFTTAESGVDGKFAVYNLVFSDSLKIRLQGMAKRGNQSLSFRLTPFEPPKIALVKVPYYPLTVDAQQLSDYLKRAAQDQEISRKIRESRERLLQEVTIKAKKEVQRDSRKLYGSADATIKVTPQLAAGRMNVLDILAGRVAGVQVVGSGMNASVFIRGSQSEPQFVLDGMPVDKDFISSLNVNDVESIDVLKGASAAIFGSRGGSGVISILTKRGNENYDYSQDIVPGVLVSKIAGYSTPRDFYAPKYEVKMPQGAVPDYRATVFWAPMVKTDKNGKARIEYFNSDAATRIDVRVEALSPLGQPGFAKSGYVVN